MEQQTYQITPKGWLAARIGNFEEAEAIWNELTEFVKKQATKNGMPEDGTPCLVLEGGGHCITADKNG